MSKRHTLFAWLVPIFTIILCLIAGEIGVRLLHLGPRVFYMYHGNYRLSADPQLGYELVPGSPDNHTVISRQGLRDRDYGVTKPADTFRIAMIGDSVTYGLGVAQNQALPESLAEQLNTSPHAAGLHYEVMNFGVSGYNSHQIAEELETKVLAFHPDLVIYVYCINDPQEYSKEMQQLLQSLSNGQRRSFESLAHGANRLFAHSHLYRLLKFDLDRIMQPDNKNTQRQTYDPQSIAIDQHQAVPYYRALHENPKRWGRTRDDIARMASLSHSHGSEFVGLIIPLLQPYSGYYPLAATDKKIAEAFRAQHADTLDLAPAIHHFVQTHRDPVGVDALHLSVAGNQFVARTVMNFLLTKALVPGNSPAPKPKRAASARQQDRT